MNKLFKTVSPVIIVLCPFVSQAQAVVQSFNSGGQSVNTSLIQVSSNFGEVFVKTYQPNGILIQEGILSSNITILALGDEEMRSVKVYPTMFRDEFNVETEYIGSEFTIFDIAGQTLKQGQLNQRKNTIKFEGPAQWYILKIQQKENGKTFAFKIRREN